MQDDEARMRWHPAMDQAARLRRERDELKKYKDELLQALIDMYPKHFHAVGILCDEYLDKSGKLLGYIRKEASKKALESLKE